ncbi:MAG: hypothetical protein LBR39_03770 [Coriobacteriales bacterium]|jgi:hypothetical protein|nr:hypothetical protein [Coriobacteriales bacterium]
MSKPATDKLSKQKQSQADVLSFIGGLVVVAAILSVIVARNDQIRRELEAMLQSALKVGRETIVQYQGVLNSIRDIRSLLSKDDKQPEPDSATPPSGAAARSLPADAYEKQWQQLHQDRAAFYPKN